MMCLKIMNRIEKIISTNDSRSHRNGLLPFVRYGGDGTVEEVTAVGGNGNYGQYVCDFTIFDNNSNKELCRLKYLDVLRNYSFIQERLNASVYTKRVKMSDAIYTVEIIKEDNCASASLTTTKSKEFEVYYWKDVTDNITIGKYEYTPLDITLFAATPNGYLFDEPYEYVEAIEKDENERTDSDILLIEKVENHKKIIEDKDIINVVLLVGYDEVISLNKWWDEWWKLNFTDTDWEKEVFDKSTANISSEFKFCEDVDKYVLGRIEVVGDEITGSRVPPYVYYLNHFELKNWFETHSATTMEAYADTTKENEWRIKEWESRGGGAFYSFLTNIEPKWQTQKVSIVNDKYFTYSPPLLEMDVIINSEEEYETMYNTYEYNVNDGKLEGAVQPYTPTSFDDMIYVDKAYIEDDGEIKEIHKYYLSNTVDKIVINDEELFKITSSSTITNGLTPRFLDCKNSLSYCESKLDTLLSPRAFMVNDKIFGLFDEFYVRQKEDDPIIGQLFECKYVTGWSETPEINYTYSGYSYVYFDDEEGIESRDREPMVGEDFISAKVPSVSSNVYQVCGTKIIGEPTIEYKYEHTFSGGTNEKPDYEIWGVSALTTYQYGWWECRKYNNSDMECADGEYVSPGNNKKYRNVTILPCFDNLIGSAENGDVYYIMARYDNGVIYPSNIMDDDISKVHSLKIPYVCGIPLNQTSYNDGVITYDEVESIEELGDTVIIRYIKGITSGTNKTISGIHYEEISDYEKGLKINTVIDGIDAVDIYYDAISPHTRTIYNSEYKCYRQVNLAKITGMEIGGIWTEESAVEAMLFTKDGFEGLKDEPKYNINLLYNRGNAAAWENHFKLSECNTMEDLENYGNNFFNI